MNCQLCNAYIPLDFDRCPACGAPVKRNTENQKKQDMLIWNGEEIPVRILEMRNAFIWSPNAGRTLDGKMILGERKSIRQFIVEEECQT